MDTHTQCPGCTITLQEPYIRCAECPVQTCLHCFARGLEVDRHKSDHNYIVIKHDFSLFDKAWTAAEEMRLLEAVADCGVGNWTDISHQMQTKSKQDCEHHYYRYYISDAKYPLPELEDPMISMHPAPVTYKMCEDPPRPAVASLSYTEMAGYLAARGDFTTEYNNYAETDLRELEFTETDGELDKELKISVLDIYWHCLKERQRRKRIVRNYGLINLQKLQAQSRRFDATIRSWVEGLRSMLKVCSPYEWDKYLEGLHYELELRQEIKRLQEYRHAGITRLRSARLYRNLKTSQDQTKERRNALTNVLSNLKDESATQQWLQRQAALGGAPVTLPNASRKSAPPLDIIGMPGYDKLLPREKEMCASVRLVPQAFLDFKTLLVNECRKHGCLKLAQARQMIKIDVNKTRKIYDFLVAEGLLNKEPLPAAGDG
ncbi:transcriptional adapter 2-alpha [Lingula anatina]|uniref:Transcriptional adapter n=1 Tax=Lingula anatina TaxID=7574 RepID=A0A1S3HRX2_LINAN|nr:transcriptional adapter 2-alpha [Lingula anatina]XP_013387804.1 transcriptional adapter 2-alpha [Lingula anatina]|eukprot:XP_013387803.1 transcriptional adapter 2-alpha [Lingula anatina]